MPAAVLFVLVLATGAIAAETKTAPKAAASPAAEPLKLSIKWSTSSEVDNYGFFVMRGDAEKGPFKAVNVKVVPGAGNSDLPRKYSYDDLDVEMGKTYYYYLDAVSTQGLREKYSPVMEKQCCDRGAEKAPEAREIKPEKPAVVTPASASPSPVASPKS